MAKLLQTCSLCKSKCIQFKLLPIVSVRSCHTVQSNNVHDRDVVILGGGMVGSAMACALGHDQLLNNKRITLLEGAPNRPFTITDKYVNRTCTLSRGSIKLLDRLSIDFKFTNQQDESEFDRITEIGAWDEIQSMRCQPVNSMQIWDSCSNSLITFNEDDISEDIAYVAENNVILEGIKRRLEAVKDRVEVQYGCRAESIHIPGVNSTEPNTWITIKLQDGQTLRTKLLIGSDGMNSAVRKAANFHTIGYSYNQTAVVAVLHIEKTNNTVAWQRFLPTGPIALLPLSDSVFNLIWSTTPAEASRLLSLTDESFVDAINDGFWHEREINWVASDLGEIFQNVINTVAKPDSTPVRQLPPSIKGIQEKSRASFPLGLTHSSNYIRQRIALIGDAAHRLHPLAGQGVNLGFGDVTELSNLVSKAAHDGSDLGAVSYLKEYETARQRKVLPVMMTIDGLYRLYSTDMTPLVLLRSLGLQATNAMGFLKKRILENASS